MSTDRGSGSPRLTLVPVPHPEPSGNPLIYFLLLALFVASGAAALIYEVVWFHLLRFTIGSSTLSLGILLASFMGGLCIGSLWCHRVVAVRYHPLKAYTLIELGIALCGIAVPLALPFVAHVYVASAGYGPGGILLRSLVCVVLLLPPTILMGATLPAISRWMQLTSVGYSRLGFFYSANIVGAVIGTAVAGFYLLRNFDVYVASGVAVALNLVIGITAYRLASRNRYESAAIPDEGVSPFGLSTVHTVIAVSGLTALGGQVVWTRMLSLLLGTTVYTFTVILAVFLVGLGVGGALGSYACRTSKNPARLLAILQAMLVVSIPYAAFAITSIVPELHVLVSRDHWLLRSVDDVLRVAVALIPPTLLWGASFPLAVAAAGHLHRDPSRLVGHLYAANTIGAILGSLGFSVVVVALVGTRYAQVLLTLCSGLAAFLMLRASATDGDGSPSASSGRGPRRGSGLAAAIAVLVVSLVAAWLIPSSHPGTIAYGREISRWNEPATYLYAGEGRHASIAVSKTREPEYRSFHINGKTEASTWPEDMRLQRMLGHIPAILHPDPQTVLIMGFGAGVTAGVFTRYPSVQRIVIVEIEPTVTTASGRYFKDENYDVLNDPRTEVIYDDARHYIATTKDTFDVITTDPIHPWTKGAAALYTREFFELGRARLNPGGFISQWVPLYETSPEAVKSQIGTFLDVFPYGSIWNSEIDLNGYDVTLLGQVEPVVVDQRELQIRIDGDEQIRRSLADVNVTFAADLLRAYAGRREDIAGWLGDYQPNLDRNLRLEYLAGEALNRYDEQRIYNGMTARLVYPLDFFRTDSETERDLRRTFRVRYGHPD